MREAIRQPTLVVLWACWIPSVLLNFPFLSTPPPLGPRIPPGRARGWGILRRVQVFAPADDALRQRVQVFGPPNDAFSRRVQVFGLPDNAFSRRVQIIGPPDDASSHFLRRVQNFCFEGT